MFLSGQQVTAGVLAGIQPHAEVWHVISACVGWT